VLGILLFLAGFFTKIGGLLIYVKTISLFLETLTTTRLYKQSLTVSISRSQ